MKWSSSYSVVLVSTRISVINDLQICILLFFLIVQYCSLTCLTYFSMDLLLTPQIVLTILFPVTCNIVTTLEFSSELLSQTSYITV